MSKTLNQNVKTWKVFECKLGASLTRRNPQLSHNDVTLVANAITVNLAIVYESLGCSLVEIPHRYLSVINRKDLREIAAFNKKALTYFLRYRKGEGDGSFKHYCEDSQIVYENYFGPLTKTINSFFQEPNPLDLGLIIQFFTGWSRIKLDSYDYTASNLSDYLSTEQRLSELSVPRIVLESLNSIISDWFRTPFDVRSLERHGNGAVADLRTREISKKYSSLSTDPLLYYCTREIPCSPNSSFDRRSKTIFVPKTILGDRVISMEPVTLQYWQQSVSRSLDDWFSSHPILRHVIHLHDQSYNREAARRASYRGSGIATIDLSSASDSVSWKVVKAVFRGTPLLRWLYGTRSTRTMLPNGDVLELEKFAPMGSSLCFPIECLLFSSICELAYRVARIPRDINISKVGYLVYGDDIIVPTKIWNVIVAILESTGFITNASKSFQHDSLYFRESCGGEYYEGVDITPIRLPRKYTMLINEHGKVIPRGFEQRIELCNTLFTRGLRVSRKLLLDSLLALPPTQRPFFGVGGLQSIDNHNDHLVKTYNQDHQQWYVLHGSTESRVARGPDEESYLHWLHCTTTRKQLEEPVVSTTGATATWFGRGLSLKHQ